MAWENPTCGRVELSNRNTHHYRVAPYNGRNCKVVNITILQTQHIGLGGFTRKAINGGLLLIAQNVEFTQIAIITSIRIMAGDTEDTNMGG